jgi:hypothetical protein
MNSHSILHKKRLTVGQIGPIRTFGLSDDCIGMSCRIESIMGSLISLVWLVCICPNRPVVEQNQDDITLFL